MARTTTDDPKDAVKSTNGRSLPRLPLPARLGFAALGWVTPEATKRLAAWLFCHPKRAAMTAAEAKAMASGHRFWLEVDGFRLAAWSWGDGPTVVLHHGWGGRASQMAAFVTPLVEAGFSVIAYDAPAHGDSPGRITAAPEMARILRAVDRRVMGIHAVIGHSLGCAVTLLAVGEGLHLNRAVLLAPPSDLRGFIDAFASCIGLDPRRFSDLGDYAAAKFNANWQEMHIGHWREGAHPPLLIFHDRSDEVLDLDHAHAIVEEWGNARLIVTEKLGHRRIRRDPELVRVAVEFLTEGNESDRENGVLSWNDSQRVPS